MPQVQKQETGDEAENQQAEIMARFGGKKYAELCGSVVRIKEIGSNQEVWKLGIGLEQDEY